MESKIQEMFDQIEKLKSLYEKHFKRSFPQRIIGWWDPLNIVDNPDELAHGLKEMQRDITTSIDTDTPIEEMTEEEWNHLIF